MAKKKGWDILRNQDVQNRVDTRDVFEDQQIERSRIEGKQTMTSRAIMAVVISFLIGAAMWFLVGASEMAGAGKTINRAWNEYFYSNDGADSDYDYITIRYQVQETSGYKNTPVFDDDGNPVMKDLHVRYILTKSTGVLIDITNKTIPAYAGTGSGEDDTDTGNADPAPRFYYRLDPSIDVSVLRDLEEDLPDYYLGYLDNNGYVIMVDAIQACIDYDGSYGPEDVVLGTGFISNEELAVYGFEQQANGYRNYRLDLKKRPVNKDGMFKDKSFDPRPTPLKLIVSSIVSLIAFGLIYMVLKKNLDVENVKYDVTDINQYQNDQHIAFPEEIHEKYDVFPDVGAHSSVQVSSLISHQMITNKGLKKVQLAKRADKDIKDEDGDVAVYKGDILRNDEGEPITIEVPIIDNDFSEALFDSSKTPKDKRMRRYFDTTQIPYNPGNENLDKLKDYDTVAEVINKDWEFPVYEPQRPGGMYIVDTAPVNTMVLAITRAGKGQTIIEPTIDMWTRELRPNNMVINDPKGELLVKNYVRGTVRGFTIVQFNLINPTKTDIYNPLALAAEAARDGNSTKCAMYVENIAEVFFPVDGGEDPVWPNAANNAFKRAAYGLIDFYLEEEKEMRRIATVKNVDKKVLEHKIDEMWGKVTLYNCYQLFVQMSSKKQQQPNVLAKEKIDEMLNGRDYSELSPEEEEEMERISKEALERTPIWENQKEPDLLTLYFNATDYLPKNSMRTLVSNANNALKSMGGAEKMMASVYGIAITAMSFFTDPTISTLTSGTLSQNIDLAGLSFPRRFGVRFHMDYLKAQHFIGMQCFWESFKDPEFKESLGKDFVHEDTVSREGWAKYFFKGIYPDEKAYIRLQIKDTGSGMLVKTFYFEFQKDYKTSYDGRTYMRDPVLDEKIVQNGFLTEMIKVKDKNGNIVFRRRPSTFDKDTITNILEIGAQMEDMSEDEKKDLRESAVKRESVKTNTIISLSCKYQEKCKMVFLVTPPHLMKYAKLILILVKQLVDLNFDQSYMTKSNQKP